jgi:3-oxoacyl-[acyl-carrier protein] reductase
MTIPMTGRRILLTGGTRGIGKGLAVAFARSGGRVLTCYRGDEDAAASTASELKEIGEGHLVIRADVSGEDGIAELARVSREEFGALDTVVHCAGTISHVPFSELSLDEWHRVLDTNLTAAYRLVQATLPLLGPGGSVVLVGSRSATVGIPMRAHYTAAKAGLIGLARSLAKELGPAGVRVNVVAPGVIDSDDAPLPAQVRERYQGLTALGRLGQAREVAGAVLFLASDLASYVTGEVLHVDGGI